MDNKKKRKRTKVLGAVELGKEQRNLELEVEKSG
jgi:hypothetical protein